MIWAFMNSIAERTIEKEAKRMNVEGYELRTVATRSQAELPVPGALNQFGCLLVH